MLIVAAAAVASNRLPVSSGGLAPGASPVGASPSRVPGAYVAVPGAWHTRWVRVVDPPPGTPAFVKQRYQVIHYVGAP